MDNQLINLKNIFNKDSVPIKFYPKLLQKEYEAVRSKYEDGELKPAIDIEKLSQKIEKRIIKRGEEVENVLNQKELRYIPYLAYQGDSIFLKNDHFFKYCRYQIKSSKKSSVISGWLHNFLKNRNLESANHEHVGSLLKLKFKNYDGRSKRIIFWSNNIDKILDNENVSAITILNQGISIKNFLQEYRLSRELNESDFTDEIIKKMTKICRDKYPRYLQQVLEELKFQQSDGSVYYRKNEIVKYVASHILKKAGIKCSEERKDLIKKPLLNCLKDPRIITNINWVGVNPDSTNVMKQWLSARDIEFFFEVVSKTEERLGNDTHWEYRRAFWMSYLPHIENTWVIMGNQAREIAKLYINRRELTNSDIGSLKGAESIQSVFFLDFGKIHIVEYSHNGASRVWMADESPLNFRKRSIHVDTIRRDAQNYIERFIHTESERYRWQRKLSSWLNRNFDIELTQPYRIN